MDGGGQILPPLAFYALELSILIWGVPDLVQFIFCSYNVSSERSGPKGCPRKKLECDFWGRGQNPKVQIAKKNLKDILNNAKSNIKAQAT